MAKKAKLKEQKVLVVCKKTDSAYLMNRSQVQDKKIKGKLKSSKYPYDIFGKLWFSWLEITSAMERKI